MENGPVPGARIMMSHACSTPRRSRSYVKSRATARDFCVWPFLGQGNSLLVHCPGSWGRRKRSSGIESSDGTAVITGASCSQPPAASRSISVSRSGGASFDSDTGSAGWPEMATLAPGSHGSDGHVPTRKVLTPKPGRMRPNSALLRPVTQPLLSPTLNYPGDRASP